MRVIWRYLAVFSMLAGLLVIAPGRSATAAGTVGTGTAGSCTEAALDTALAGGGAVSFDCGAAPHTIPLTTEKVIAADTQIDGGGLITLDGQDSVRIFYVNNGINLDLSGITLTRGSSTGSGGAIFIDQGTVTVTNSTLSSNTSSPDGGAIFNDHGILTVVNSTLSGNSGNFGGAILNDGTLALTNSTLSHNSASVFGGGLANLATLSLQNTIIANSPSGGNCGGIAISSQGGNLSDDSTCNLNQPSDLDNTEDNLGALANNGGVTLTHLPQTGSLAIDNGLAGPCPAEDQRGISRPQGAGCDIGAVEVESDDTAGAYPLCVSYYTGLVTSPLYGGCRPGTVEITPFDKSFCVASWTGQLTYPFGQPCAPLRWTHTMPDDGDLLTCVSYYTSTNRWVFDHSQCTAYEVPNTIPAMP